MTLKVKTATTVPIENKNPVLEVASGMDWHSIRRAHTKFHLSKYTLEASQEVAAEHPQKLTTTRQAKEIARLRTVNPHERSLKIIVTAM